MFRILVSLIKIAFYLLLILTGYVTISDVFLNTYYFDYVLEYSHYFKYIGFISIAYLSILILSFIEMLFKKSKVVKSTSKNGKVEVNLETINDLGKTFLETKTTIKSAKVLSHTYFSKIIINASVETYNIDKLNERLDIIQNELKEYIITMTGVPVKAVSIKIVKINKEKIFDEVELEEKPLESASEEEIISKTPEF